MAALILKKRTCAAKIEATAGTAESLAGTDGAENFFDPSHEVDIGSYERQGQDSFSMLPSVPGAQGAKSTFKTEVYNSGTSTNPFWATVLLLGCGMQAATGVYTPLTGAVSTLTWGYYVSGALWTMAGAMGSFKLVADKVGEPIKVQWELTGVHAAPSATALITPTYPTLKPPRFAGATLSLGAIALVVKKFEIDLGNKVTLRESAAATPGYLTGLVTDRNPKMTMTVEVPAVGTHDYFDDLVTSAENAFSCAVGTGTNGIVTIAAPKLQLRSAPKLSDQDGILTYDLEYGLNRSASAGDDELSITFS